MDKNWQKWETMRNNEQQLATMVNNGQQWAKIGKKAKNWQKKWLQWAAMGNNGLGIHVSRLHTSFWLLWYTRLEGVGCKAILFGNSELLPHMSHLSNFPTVCARGENNWGVQSRGELEDSCKKMCLS